MHGWQSNFKSWSGSLISLVLIFLCNIGYTQVSPENDTLNKIPPEKINKIMSIVSLISKELMQTMPATIVPTTINLKDKNLVFFDSLKAKASKNHLTKRLYSIVIVNPDTTHRKPQTPKSDEDYSRYSGKKIRKIIIQRLDVFGADIKNPASTDYKKFENLLNKTHINTNENIIRKNLLFSEGDKISPLTLSDNERILRQLPYIDDARIVIIPVSNEESDIVVFTKDVYSLGASYEYKGISKGNISVFDKNIFGMGQELGIDMPYDNHSPDSPAFGGHYIANNIAKSFVNMHVYYLHGLGEKTFGFSLTRKLVSSATRYAGGISIQQMYTSEDLDTMAVPVPLKYNLQDYWMSRSFLINKESVSRIIIGARYTNNNVFNHPVITPESYYKFQRYKIYLASAALSIQKYTKTSLIYGYGRTEDIPYGALFKVTAGREFNEFKQRTYLGGEVSFSHSSKSLGYFYFNTGISTYFNTTRNEQGLLCVGMNYFSNLINMGRSKIRNFIYLDYTRGFGRYADECLRFKSDNGFTGFKNDSINGTQRLSVSLESVMFSPVNFYGFRFAFFGFTDFSFLSGTTERLGNGYTLSSLGIGVRIRNDNLVFNTLQIRFGYFPNPPQYSRITSVNVSGEQLLRPSNFDPGPPSVIQYR
jgi:hypothetical protein